MPQLEARRPICFDVGAILGAKGDFIEKISDGMMLAGRTATNLEGKMKFAGFWRRAGAYWIDVIPIALIVFLLFYFFLGFDAVLGAYFEAPSNIDKRITFLSQRNQIRDLTFVIWIVYSAIAEISSLQGTFGKKLLGIKVVDRDGHRIGFGRAFVRNISKILSLIPFGLGFLWVAFSKEKKGWHDIIAKTYVIDKSGLDIPKQYNDETAGK